MARYINSIKFEEVNGWPIITIEKDGKERFLMPFRYRKFQVCETRDGELDMGSGYDKDWSRIINMDPEYAKIFLKKELGECLSSYLHTSYGWPGEPIGVTYLTNLTMTPYQEETGLREAIVDTIDVNDVRFVDEFIDATYELVKARYAA